MRHDQVPGWTVEGLATETMVIGKWLLASSIENNIRFEVKTRN